MKNNFKNLQKIIYDSQIFNLAERQMRFNINFYKDYFKDS